MDHAIKTLENRLSNLKKTKDANTLIHEEHTKEAAEYLAQARQNEIDIQEIEAALIKLKENK
jgi:hypothetical protein